jgi:hypothetical protein
LCRAGSGDFQLGCLSGDNGILPPVKPGEGESYMENPKTFNARLVSTSSKRVYRVCARGSDLIFIQLAGLSGTARAVTIHFGLLGMWVGELLRRRAMKQGEATLQSAEHRDPEQLLRENENNFNVHIPEIHDSSIEPPALFQLHDKQAGRWNFARRDGKKMRFEFETADEMKTALDVLPRLLKATLKVNVEWDETKNRFQKTKRRH